MARVAIEVGVSQMSFTRRDKITIGLVVSLVGFVVVTAILGFVTTHVKAEKSPYDSGHSHGCSDAGEDPDDRYINEKGKGPSFHTNEFMNGYNDGYNDCSGSSSGGGNENYLDNDNANSNANSNRNDNRLCIIGPC